jgi:hypothetical protein
MSSNPAPDSASNTKQQMELQRRLAEVEAENMRLKKEQAALQQEKVRTTRQKQ